MIKDVIKQLLVAYYFLQLLREGLWNPLKKILPTKKRMIILAIGPSLKDFKHSYYEDRGQYCDCDCFAMNDFVKDDIFSDIKPEHYVLSDPMFFVKNKQNERGLTTLKKLKEQVQWHTYLYVPYAYRKSEYLSIVKENKNIELVYFHSAKFPSYTGLDKERFFFYRRGWGNGELGTVLLNAIYISITLKYNWIELYGADHTFFDGLCVNDDNIPCHQYAHSFDKEPVLRPIAFTYSDRTEFQDMDYYITEKAGIFRGHKIMAAYARQQGVEVLNCTKGSLIDAYPRKRNV